MKKSYVGKTLVCVVLILIISFSCAVMTASATDNNYVSKIDPELIGILQNASDDEIIPISIWFEDIDKAILSEEIVETAKSLVDKGFLSDSTISLINLETAQIETSYNASADEIKTLVEIKE